MIELETTPEIDEFLTRESLACGCLPSNAQTEIARQFTI